MLNIAWGIRLKPEEVSEGSKKLCSGDFLLKMSISSKGERR